MEVGRATTLFNLLTDDIAAHIREVLLSEDFAWYWNERTLDEAPQSTHQFTHLFWVQGKANSSFAYIPTDILRAVETALGIKVHYISRAKANLLCTLGDIDVDQQCEVHADLYAGDKAYSVVYYVGESDGDTVVYNEEAETARAQHKDNTAIVFNSLTKHRGSLPRQHKRRVVVNIVFQAA